MSTVAELIEFLKTQKQDATVVLARDEEGNGFLPWSGWSDGLYSREEEQFDSYGNIEEEPDEYDSIEDMIEQGYVDSVVLWP